MPIISQFSMAIWILSIALNFLLTFLIYRKRMICKNSFLFSYTLCAALFDSSLLALFLSEKAAAYFWTYWVGRYILSCLQIGIMWNICLSFFGINDQWKKSTVYALVAVTTLAVTLAAVAVSTCRLPLYFMAAKTTAAIDRWLSLSACILFLIAAFCIDVIGIHWDRETLLIGTGLAMQGAAVTAVSWLSTIRQLTQLEMRAFSDAREVIAVSVVALWIYCFAKARNPQHKSSTKSDELASLIAHQNLIYHQQKGQSL